MRAAATWVRGATDATRIARGIAEIAHPLAAVAEHREDGPERFCNAETERARRPQRGAVLPHHGAWRASVVERPRPTVLHHTGIPDFLLPFAEREAHPVLDDLRDPQGHRAIGVVYHPALEQHGNYVPTILPGRYDAFSSLDETRAVAPLHMPVRVHGDLPETYPPGV